jgi:hypothetical protein
MLLSVVEGRRRGCGGGDDDADVGSVSGRGCEGFGLSGRVGREQWLRPRATTHTRVNVEPLDTLRRGRSHWLDDDRLGGVT